MAEKDRPVIEVTDLVKTYHMGDQSLNALDGVSFTVQRGEMTAILGASGSGKSTLMNIIGCLDRPTAGTYLLEGEDVAKLSDSRLARIRNQRIGFVFQNFNLLARMSALENVEVPLLYSGVSHAKDRAMEALKRVGLEERHKHEPNQLSGGQRQRVAIARALVTEPSLILADEPTGNLDTRTGTEIMHLFHELNGQGVTLLIVTHEHEIASCTRRAVHVRDGKIVSDDPMPGHIPSHEPAPAPQTASA